MKTFLLIVLFILLVAVGFRAWFLRDADGEPLSKYPRTDLPLDEPLGSHSEWREMRRSP